MDRSEVGQRARRAFLDGLFRRRARLAFHPRFVPTFRQRPGEAHGLGSLQVLVDRADADGAASSDLLVTQLEFIAEAQDLP
jgi:hypothetical protein